jgi:hypothetical protein
VRPNAGLQRPAAAVEPVSAPLVGRRSAASLLLGAILDVVPEDVGSGVPTYNDLDGEAPKG